MSKAINTPMWFSFLPSLFLTVLVKPLFPGPLTAPRQAPENPAICLHSLIKGIDAFWDLIQIRNDGSNALAAMSQMFPGCLVGADEKGVEES